MTEAKQLLIKRYIFFSAGLIILSLGVTLTIKGHVLGLSPWDVLHYGLWETFGLTIGSWGIIIGAVIVIITSIAMRKLPAAGVYINMFCIGIFIDIFNFLLPDPENLTVQIVLFCPGVIVMAFGVAFYITPNLGAGPRDSLMLVLVQKFNFKLSSARNVMELGALFFGFLLGGPVFIGTLLIVLCLGKLIEKFLPITRRMLVRYLGHDDPNIIKVKN
ncbi:YczE/YyaS/YitT family protein [Corticicoccus populi]|uniref:YitT family protein n=1 Tax=Corticicoccus populi TaxID=1812821 RepID=A0ABW5WZM7_9STAP